MTDRNWHWEQGTKYAIEGVKALLAINGGAAVALLAFAAQIGKNGGASIVSSLGDALFSFGVGALLAAIGFVTAYVTQLHYGNYYDKGDENAWYRARRWHNATYGSLLLSIVAFLIGLWFARAAILASLTQGAS